MTRLVLLAGFAAGLLVRVLILWQTADLGPVIADEHHYVELATSLTEGRGFAWATGERTSLRPPLYPALIAGVWSATGTKSLQAVRLVQFLLAAITSALIYDLGRRVFTVRVGATAALITWLYPSLIYMNVSLLTETLFTTLLVAFVWLAVRLVERPGAGVAVACGIALGLGALTRSVLWPLPIVLCPLLVLLLKGVSIRQRVLLPMALFAGFVLMVAPWAVRNTRLQHVTTIVDTMGGMNLRMGNYEHTPEDRIWDAVSLKGEKNWVYALTREPAGPPPPGGVFTEGMKDKWAQRKAIEYMKAHPGTTMRRALIKFADVWGLERSYAAGVQQGLYEPPRILSDVAIAAMFLSYVALALSGVAGFWLVGIRWRLLALLLLPVLAITGAHTIVFGHERYHLPLVPILACAAAAFWGQRLPRWQDRRAAFTGMGICCGALLVIWLRQIFIVDYDKVRTMLGG